MAGMMKGRTAPAGTILKTGDASDQRTLARAFYDTPEGLVAKCSMALVQAQYAIAHGLNENDYFGGDPKRAESTELYFSASSTMPWFWEKYESFVCKGQTLSKPVRKERFKNRMRQMWEGPGDRKRSRIVGHREFHPSTEHPRRECPALWERFCNTFSAGEVITPAKLTAFLRGQ